MAHSQTPLKDPCDHDHDAEQSPLATHGGGDAVCVDHVTFSYSATDAAGGDETPVVLNDVSLHVARGERVGIIGPNGAGKTTLVKLMLGLLSPTQGSIKLEGLSPQQACRQGNIIGYVPQRHDVAWNFPLSVRQVVAMGLNAKLGRWSSWLPLGAKVWQQVDAVLDQVGMSALRERPIGDLSGGQQQRVFLARALVHEPKVLILDEPLNGVDVAGRESFSHLLGKLATQRGLTMLTVSHDLAAVAAGCDSVACLNRKIHYHASPAGLTREVLMEVFEHDVGVLVGDAT